MRIERRFRETAARRPNEAALAKRCTLLGYFVRISIDNRVSMQLIVVINRAPIRRCR